jgi:hypothetical protein
MCLYTTLQGLVSELPLLVKAHSVCLQGMCSVHEMQLALQWHMSCNLVTWSCKCHAPVSATGTDGQHKGPVCTLPFLFQRQVCKIHAGDAACCVLLLLLCCRKDTAHIWELAGGEALTAQLTQGSHVFLTHRQVSTPCWQPLNLRLPDDCLLHYFVTILCFDESATTASTTVGP